MAKKIDIYTGDEKLQNFSFTAPEAVRRQLVGNNVKHWQEHFETWRTTLESVSSSHHCGFLADTEWWDDLQ